MLLIKFINLLKVIWNKVWQKNYILNNFILSITTLIIVFFAHIFFFLDFNLFLTTFINEIYFHFTQENISLINYKFFYEQNITPIYVLAFYGPLSITIYKVFFLLYLFNKFKISSHKQKEHKTNYQEIILSYHELFDNINDIKKGANLEKNIENIQKNITQLKYNLDYKESINPNDFIFYKNNDKRKSIIFSLVIVIMLYIFFISTIIISPYLFLQQQSFFIFLEFVKSFILFIFYITLFFFVFYITKKKEIEMLGKLIYSTTRHKIFFDTISHETYTPLQSLNVIINLYFLTGEIDYKNLGKIHHKLYYIFTKIQNINLNAYRRIENFSTYNTIFETLDLLSIDKNRIKLLINEKTNYNRKTKNYISSDVFHLILANLVKNALKFSDEKIIIKLFFLKKNIKISIQNISDTIIDKKMKPFIFLPRIKGNASGGSGLGLFIINEVAYENGINLKLDFSKKDNGTQFSFKFKFKEIK